METTNFLVEIGTEELPPKALRKLENAFAAGIEKRLTEARLNFGGVQSFATPRRLAVLVRELQAAQPDQQVERRGPPVKIAFDDDGKPTKAAEKFANGNGVGIEELERLETDKGEYLLFRGEEKGQAAADLLPAFINEALAELPIPRRMRWGDSDVEFVRPVHWVVALLDGAVLDCEVLGHKSGNSTRGHRFHAPQEIAISTATAYADTLAEQGKVIAGFLDRKERVLKLAEDTAKSLGGNIEVDDELADEVTALVEWPVPISGEFDEKFLALPPEVLIYTLQEHQRYFPVRNADGSLANSFITISNLESTNPEQIKLGNERVVLPRLSDAAFFWDQDRKQSLAERVSALESVVYQKGLGSLRDKTDRIVELAAGIASVLGENGENADSTRRAAELSKADLLTELVGEFPVLQGKMGYYYAKADGEDDAVAVAIGDQYLPRFAGDTLPSASEGQAVSIADRLDTLAGIFCLGKRPSGSKDPFSLRRMALGLVRILIEAQIDLDLKEALKEAVALQPVELKDKSEEDVANELYDFVIERLKAYYLDGQSPSFVANEISPEIFESVRVQRPASPLDFHQRLAAVVAFSKLDAAASLASANKRIANILKKSADDAASDVNADLLREPQEQRLFDTISELEPGYQAAVQQRDYNSVLEQLAALKDPVDEFFDGVMVNAEEAELKANRLAILKQLRGLFLEVADLSALSS